MCSERPYNGTISNTDMDQDRKVPYYPVDPEWSTWMENSKIVTAGLIELLFAEGFGFVSKCLKNFEGDTKRHRVSVMQSEIDPSFTRDE